MESRLIVALCKKAFYNFKEGEKYTGEEQKLHQKDENPTYQVYQEETKEGELKGGISMANIDFNQYFEICDEETSKLKNQKIEIENKRILNELWKPLKKKIMEHLDKYGAELQVTPEGQVVAKSNKHGFSFVNLELNLSFKEATLRKQDVPTIESEVEKIKQKKNEEKTEE